MTEFFSSSRCFLATTKPLQSWTVDKKMAVTISIEKHNLPWITFSLFSSTQTQQGKPMPNFLQEAPTAIQKINTPSLSSEKR
jgi:hypothetical protein